MAETFTPLTLSSINGQVSSAVTSINQNFATLQTLLLDVLSLSGSSPNAMQANLNMNNFNIINLPAATNVGEPVTYDQLQSFLGGTFTISTSASTLTGTTLATGVITSSLTTIGTLIGGAVPITLVTGMGAGNLAFLQATLGTGIATFLHTPSSANFFASITDETGSGVLVGNISPTFTGSVVFPDTGVWNSGGIVATAVSAPTVEGGTGTAATLTLQSTAGIGSGDSIIFKTGSQATAGTILTGGTWTFNKGITVASATATTAGGSTTAALLFGTTAGFGIYYGSGLPTITAAQGSLYLRSDGSSGSTRLYVNSTGSTTWVNFTSVS